MSASSRIRRRAEPPEHRIFQLAGWFSTATFSSLSCRRRVTISASLSPASCRCAARIGMMATYYAIIRASSRSFFARTPRAWATDAACTD